ncbi:hypothetical protein [Martelella lutilitoris]|nr:hypothetical protein [Martelella lutilitoris]
MTIWMLIATAAIIAAIAAVVIFGLTNEDNAAEANRAPQHALEPQ